MTSLQRAYKTACIAVNSTGAAPSNFMFMEQMEEIFGTRPIPANKHTLNLFGEPSTAISMEGTVLLEADSPVINKNENRKKISSGICKRTNENEWEDILNRKRYK